MFLALKDTGTGARLYSGLNTTSRNRIREIVLLILSMDDDGSLLEDLLDRAHLEMEKSTAPFESWD